MAGTATTVKDDGVLSIPKPKAGQLLMFSHWPFFRVNGIVPHTWEWAKNPDGSQFKRTIQESMTLQFHKGWAMVGPEHVKPIRAKPYYGYQFIFAFVPSNFKLPKDAGIEVGDLIRESLYFMVDREPKRANGFISEMAKNMCKCSEGFAREKDMSSMMLTINKRLMELGAMEAARAEIEEEAKAEAAKK